MANPLVNELIIGTGQKDLWNATEPESRGRVPRLLSQFAAGGCAEPALRSAGAESGHPGDGPHRPGQRAAEISERAADRQLHAQEPLRRVVAVEPRRRSGSAPAAEAAVGAGGRQRRLAQWPAAQRRRDRHCAARRRRRADGPKPPASAALKLGDGVNFNIGARGQQRHGQRDLHQVPVPAHAPRRPQSCPHGLRVPNGKRCSLAGEVESMRRIFPRDSVMASRVEPFGSPPHQ